MTKYVLDRPLWTVMVGLFGITWCLVLLSNFIVVGIFAAGDWPLPAVVIILWDLVGFCVLFFPTLVFLRKRFVKVRPSASFAWEWDTGPWLHIPGNPSTSIAINWLAIKRGDAKVLVGQREDSMEERSGTRYGSGVSLCRVVLDNLEPDTPYHYRIPDLKDGREIYSFQTAPTRPSNQDTTFVVVGDTQNGGAFGQPNWAFPEIVAGWRKLLEQTQLDLLLHVGDACDQGNDLKSWHAFLDTAAPIVSRVPLQIAVGNHDTGTHYMHDPDVKKYPDEGANFDYLLGYKYGYDDLTKKKERNLAANQITPFRGRFYAINFKNCCFLFVDTQNRKMAAPWNPQWIFIDKILTEATRQHLWKIVLVHWPMIEIKLDASGNPTYNYTKFARFLCPLFDKHGVNLVISGHAHNFTRMMWKYGPSISFYDATHTWPHKEIPYIISGGGGNDLRRGPAENEQNIPLEGFVYRENSSHYLLVRASEDTLSVEAHYPTNDLVDGQKFEIKREKLKG